MVETIQYGSITYKVIRGLAIKLLLPICKSGKPLAEPLAGQTVMVDHLS